MSYIPTGQGHEVYFAPIAANAAGGDTTIVAADTQSPARKVRIFALFFIAKAAVTVTLKSGSTSLSGAMSFAINGGVSHATQPSAHFMETKPGDAFIINTSVDGVYGWCGYTVENV